MLVGDGDLLVRPVRLTPRQTPARALGERLRATGRVTEMVAFRTRGWEAVVESLPEAAVERLAGAPRRIQRIGDGRFALEFTNDQPPEQLLPELLASGGRLVSVNPVRDTLEDYFVEQVAAADRDPERSR